MAYKPQNTPGKMGKVTAPLMGKNIEIDGKTYQLVDARVDRVQQDNPQIGDEAEYKISASKDLTEKGKINFFAIKKRAGETTHTVNGEPAEPAAPKEAPKTQDIQAVYVGMDKTRLTLKDCVGEEQTYRADLSIIKILAKPDAPAHPGGKYKFRLVMQENEWVITRMGAYDESFGEKPFKTGKDILQENLDQMYEMAKKAENALAQINKENAEGDAHMKENEEYAKSLTGDQKPMPATEPLTEPEKCQPEATVKVPASFVKSKPPILNPEKEEYIDPGEPLEGESIAPMEVKVHIDMGGYTNFDLSLSDISGDRVRKRIEDDSMKMIAVMRRLMTAAKKGY